MRIAIVGAGRMGGNAARLWSRARHDVLVSFSRHPDQLAARAALLGDHVGAASPAEAVANADVVMLAVPWGAIDQALKQAGPLAGEVVLDATNQFGAGPEPAYGQTVAEFNSARLPGARYVRGFNTLTSGFQAEASSRPGDQRAVLFICGDYPAARGVVAKLIEDAGFAAVDLGVERRRRGHGGSPPTGVRLRRRVPAPRGPGGRRGRASGPRDPAHPPRLLTPAGRA